MEQNVMKTIASILVAILAAAIVSACAQDEPVSGPKAELNIAALDSGVGDISGGDSTKIPRDTTSVNGTDNSSSSNTNISVPAASPRMIAANQDRDTTAYDSWMRDISAEDTSSETVSRASDTTSAWQFDAKVIVPDTASAQVDTEATAPDTSAKPDTSTVPDIKTQPDTSDTFIWPDITAFFDIFTQPETDTGSSTLPADVFMQQEVKITQLDAITKLPDIIVAVPDIIPGTIPDTTPQFDTSAQYDIKTKFDTATTQPDTTPTIPDTAAAKLDSIVTKPDTSTATADISTQIAKFTKKNDGTTVYNNTQYGYTTKFPSWASVAEKKDSNLIVSSKTDKNANFTIDLEYIEKPDYVASYGDWFKELYGKPDEEITYQGKTMKFHSSDHGGGFNRFTYAPIGTSGALRIETNFSMPPEAFVKNFEQDALGTMYMVTGNTSQLNAKP